MFEMKMNARYILHGRKKALRVSYVKPFVMLFGFFVCLLTGLGAYFSGDVPLWDALPVENRLLIFIAFSACVLFLYLFLSARLYFSALVFSLTDKSFPVPHSFMRAGAVVRYALFCGFVLFVKTVWLIFFLSPFFCVLWALTGSLMGENGIPRVMFFVLVLTCAALLFTGVIFYIYTAQRYFLCEMLFLRNPGQSFFGILKNSVCFHRGNFLCVTLFFIRNRAHPWVLGKCTAALFMQDIFYEEKYYRRFGISQKGIYQSIPRAL